MTYRVAGADTDEPWPLEIEDHDGKIHGLTLEPGQVDLQVPYSAVFIYNTIGEQR
jgi:hypothetical protein